MVKKSREQVAEEARLREAEEVGCRGLLGRVAKNIHTGIEWGASAAQKGDGPFICSNCLSDAVLKKCTEKLDHFAHKSRLSPVLGVKDMTLHNACTREICNLLAQRFPEGKWAVERLIPEDPQRKIPKLVPDISGRMGEQRVAIEVQVSSLTLPRIVQRTRDYARRRIALIWIVPLYEPLGTAPFRPRLYERYLHSIYFGRTYYWWQGLGLTVKPVHYGTAKRHIDFREWIENGLQESAGGFDQPYKTIKTPVYGGDLNICENFRAASRAAFTPENERKKVPPSLIWRDNLPEWW